jgi:hypothetical protein
MLKYRDEWAFVSLYDGLGGPPIFCGLLVHQRRVDRAVGSGGFFLRLLLFVSVTFLCKHFMFHIYIVYVCGGVV